MKMRLLALLLPGLVAWPVLAEVESGEDGGTGPIGPPMLCPLPADFTSLAPLLWPIVDGNHDEALTKGEAEAFDPGFPRELFDVYDVYANGKVTLAEIGQVAFFVQPENLLDFMGIFDANNDGLLSWEELSSRVGEDLFRKLDRNGSGVLDCGDLYGVEPEGQPEGEAPCPLPRECPPQLPIIWRIVDANADDSWSLDEIVLFGSVDNEAMLFDGLDDDHDGALSFTELSGHSCLLFGSKQLEWDFPFDGNGDYLLQQQELMALSDYRFKALDTNGNEVIDCGDFEEPEEGDATVEGQPNVEGEWPCTNTGGQPCEGEFPWEGEPWPCDDPAAGCWEGEPWPCGANGGACEGEFPWEGEVSIEGELPPWEPCKLAALVVQLFPMLDANDDGAISLEEAQTIGQQAGYFVPDWVLVFEALDLDSNSSVSQDEVSALLVRCNLTPGDPGGEGASEGSVEEPGNGGDALVVHRFVRGNGYYTPGQPLVVEATVAAASPNVSPASFTMVETLPEGWTLTEVIESGGASSIPAAGSSGAIEFSWSNGSVPAKVAYTLTLGEASGIQAILGYAVYIDADGNIVTGPVSVTPVGEGWDVSLCHSGDYNHDWTFSLSELLREIQLYNLGGFHCGGGEDGYASGESRDLNALAECPPHTGDINGDWRFDLGELLRTIQFYNSDGGAYQVAEGSSTEDGYAPGRFELK